MAASNRIAVLTATLALLGWMAKAGAQVDDAGGGVRRIEDNSFLLEEAYNQEDGVIQHIQAFQLMREGDWATTFTQEWPVPTQQHQFSYTIPALKVGEEEGSGETGVGDVLLNYRLQAVLEGPVAFAPRVSIVLPTGDSGDGLGNEGWGVQTNLPLSVVLADRWVTHWNVGATFIPQAEGPDGSHNDVAGFAGGASAIYCVNDNFNLLFEAVGGFNESVGDDGLVEADPYFLVNPGLRWAIDCPSGLQIVPGISFPIGIGPSHGDTGVLIYLSLEHPAF